MASSHPESKSTPLMLPRTNENCHHFLHDLVFYPRAKGPDLGLLDVDSSQDTVFLPWRLPLLENLQDFPKFPFCHLKATERSHTEPQP